MAGESTVVLVLTDVEGSTRLWAGHAEAMDMAMSRHHEIVHGAVTASGGWRPVDQGEGDSVFAAFDSAAAAIAAVARFQEALAAEPWPTGIDIRVRVAVHAGEVIVRDGNLFGSTVNRCARLRGLASGGQVLLSATAFELVRDRLSDGVRVIDLGEHRMKDLARAERVYQLVMPGLPGDFPPLASLDRGSHNLAVQTSSFLGRTTEIAELVDLVRKERLVTIVGFGGMGKTRLALQVAAELADGSDDGVWFVDLSAVTDPTRVPSLIGTVLGIGESGGMLPGLLAGLQKRRLLLVLDNLEQLLPDAALLVDQFLRAAPDVRILTTSREPLRVRGEQAYQLAPLPVPPQPTAGDPWTEAELESVSTYDGVRLFLTRAAAVRREFVLTPANAGAVAAICVRLDGMPLALELAAARTRVFSPESLLPRLERALTVLTGGSRDLPPRQQTLRATIAWSYDALDPDQRGLLDRLSVFPGTFTFDAVEQICGPATRAEATDLDVLNGLTVLVDRSLVNHYPTVESGHEDRYGLLVSIRDYGAEQLTEGAREILADRHAAYYAALMTRPPEMFDPVEDPKVQRDDLHNLRAAVAHAQAGADDELEVDLARFASALTVLGQGAEARAVLDHALDRGRRATPEQVELLFSRTLLESVSSRRSDARDWATRFLAEARAVGDPSLLVMALALNMRGSRAEARRLFAEGEALLKAMPAQGTYYSRRSVERAWDSVLDNNSYGDPERVEAASRRTLAHSSEPSPSMWSMGLGWALLVYGRTPEAESLLAPFETVDGSPGVSPLHQAHGSLNAAILRTATREFTAADADLDLTEQRLRLLDVPTVVEEVAYRRAVLERATGHPAAARNRLHTLLAGSTSRSDPQLMATARWLLAVIAREAGDHDTADDLLPRAWADAAGWDAHCLPLVLQCLLERAIRVARDDPGEAVRLIGVVAHNRDGIAFLDGVSYDTDSLLSDLRRGLGDGEVQRILDATEGQDLPDAPGWPPISSRPGPVT